MLPWPCAQIVAPRTPNFNYPAADHHPLLSTAPPFNDEAIKYLDLHMRARWGTLFSIDDMVAGIAASVPRLWFKPGLDTAARDGGSLELFPRPD